MCTTAKPGSSTTYSDFQCYDPTTNACTSLTATTYYAGVNNY